MNWIAAVALAAALASPAVKAPEPKPAGPKCSNAAALWCPGFEPSPGCSTRQCECWIVETFDQCGTCLISYEICQP